MKFVVITLLLSNLYGSLSAQGGFEKNQMVNTKLSLTPDMAQKWLYGVAELTLQPHRQPTDSLELDAKGMEIGQVEMIKKNGRSGLLYSYDGLVLHIKLDRLYNAGEKYTLSIKYIARPEELGKVEKGNIDWKKGLYFVGPTNADKSVPVQIWTQGEPESNSVWFPCIDKPDQKSTEEINLTIPDKYVTLSNGVLFKQVKNGDNTRTDRWKMDQPHAPYLFFLCIGDYAIIKDHYKGKQVDYYVEKGYAPFAKRIFGNTPEMMGYFSRITGIEYPWPKYSQVAVRNFFLNGMENTTATALPQSVQQDVGDLAIGDLYWQQIIAHELFHQWFGDLVTQEDWGQICLSESFANYGEALWMGHKYGRDAADEVNWREMASYLSDTVNFRRPLVVRDFNEKSDLFGVVSYSKGGRILRMLHSYIGDSAFFKGMHVYLEKGKFKTATVEDLRRAFEGVTRLDLQWFWSQWFYGPGHPKIEMTYGYEQGAGKALVYLRQVQKGPLFNFPLTIDVYQGKKARRYKVMINKASDTLSFDADSAPRLIDVDPDRELVCERADHKSLENIIYQYEMAPTYFNRREAIDSCAKRQQDPAALALLIRTLKDPFWGLRDHALRVLDTKNAIVSAKVESEIEALAGVDPSPVVKARAISLLAMYKKKEYETIFMKALGDTTYPVRAQGLLALSRIDTVAAVREASKLASNDPAYRMMTPILIVLSLPGEKNLDAIIQYYNRTPTTRFKFEYLETTFARILAKTKEDDKLRSGIQAIVSFRDLQPPGRITYINEKVLAAIAKEKKAEGLESQVEYIQSRMK